EAGDHSQRRRLTAAARAEQREELAVADREAHVVDRRGFAEALADALQFDRDPVLRHALASLFRLKYEHMFAFICGMQLALDALDRLVDTLEERGTLTAVEAARSLFATASISDGLACSLLEDITAGDSRVVCTGTTVSLTGKRADPLLEQAEFVVFDLETTGLSAARCQICEFGAVRVRALELVDSFQALVNPGVALPEPVARLTGLREQELRRAAPVPTVLGR